MVLNNMTGAAAFLRFCIAACIAVMPVCASAQQGNTGVIRDAEIEQLLRDYANPVFKASGINASATKIILVGSRDFNAFVASGRKVFMNVGVIMESATPNQVIGVMAHEAGHIAGGHLFRLRQELERAQIIAIVGSLIGGGAAIAGTRSPQVGSSGGGTIGAILIGPEIARRSLLAYQRSEEAAADKAGLRYLIETGQSGKGMIETFERFSSESLFRRVGTDPYLQSHPSAPERISALRDEATKSPHFDKADSPALKARHELARGKLWGFLSRPDELARRYAPTDTSLPARYARAIASYRFGNPASAQAQIDDLIRAQPNNPYFWELKGQALLEGGKAREALAPLRRAISLAPNQPLLRGLLGHALVSTGDIKDANAAIKELTTASERDPDAPENFRYLARAYATKGDDAMAALSAAQGFIAEGQQLEAKRLARRAKTGLKEKSPAWLKADDIVNQLPQS